MRFLIILLICAACGSETPTPRSPDPPPIDPAQTTMGTQAFATGRSLQTRGHFAQAEQAFRQALKESPSNPQYHYYLGVVLHAQSQFKEAQTHLKKALEIKPDYAGPQIALGKMLYDVHGKVEEACEYLNSAITLAPQATEARSILGKIYQREGRLEEASTIFTAILADDSTYTPALNGLGFVHLQQGEYQQAEARLRQATRLDPHEPNAFLGLGQVYLRSGETDKGQRLIARSRALSDQNDQLQPHKDAVRKYPDQPKAHSNLASLYHRFGRLKLAAEHYHHSIRIDSTYGPGYQGLGNMYQQRGNDALSARYYLEALRWDSTLAESHNNLGLLLYKKGDLQRAIEAYKKAVQHAPEVGYYLSNLGSAYFENKQLEQAQLIAEQASAIDSTLPSTRILLGEIHASRGELRQALDRWEAIPATDPTYDHLQQRIAEVRRKLDRQEQ